MARLFTGRALSWAILASLAVAWAAVGQSALGADTSARRAIKKWRRLPNHYSKVVTEAQREKIYKIKKEYYPKIEELESKLKAIKKERNEKIAAVLTPEQQKKVEEASSKPKKEVKAVEAVPPAEKPAQ